MDLLRRSSREGADSVNTSPNVRRLSNLQPPGLWLLTAFSRRNGPGGRLSKTRRLRARVPRSFGDGRQGLRAPCRRGDAARSGLVKQEHRVTNRGVGASQRQILVLQSDLEAFNRLAQSEALQFLLAVNVFFLN